jgi:hypothetical protein
MEYEMIRQGDIFLKPCNNVNLSGATAVPAKGGRYILAEGEATGHNHSVLAEGNELFSLNGNTVLVVNELTTIEHQEHASIEIAPGQYWVVRQREYTPQKIQWVMD